MPSDDQVALPGDEQALVQALRRGDQRAFDLVVNAYGPRLLRLARGMLGNQADAEDALQQTLVGLMQSIRSFRGDASLRTWLTRIMVNQAAKLRRSRSTRSSASLDAGTDAAMHEHAAPGPGAVVAAREDVMTMLSALSPEHRDILVLRELQGLSYKEIAETLGIAQGTVESRLFRAREQMRQRFEGYRP